jgi:hypothetical protein
VGIIIDASEIVAMYSGGISFKKWPTIFTFTPYKTVASRISKAYLKFSKLIPFHSRNSRVRPTKPMTTPMIFWILILSRK